MSLLKRFTALAVAVLALPTLALAAPSFVSHDPGVQVYGEPAGVTGREPELPREADGVQLWIKIGPSFSYNAVGVYYTTDGSEPQGSQGSPTGTTSVLLSYGPGPAISFVRNEGSDDWWVATLPSFTEKYDTHFRYKISAWDTGAPVPEVFANAGAAYEYTTLLAWPGAGSGSATPSEGYPPLHFWKEEAVAGNNYINVMLDQNGSYYDVYYPSAGCVQGVATKNEGYNDGGHDQFPPGLASDQRGQMHLNEVFLGIRPTDTTNGSGVTYWLTNAAGTDFSSVSQHWSADDSNVIETGQTLVAAGHDITIQQTDFAPKGVAYPNDMGGNPNRGLELKRVLLTNNEANPVELNVYLYADWALNGGDIYDGTFADDARGAMIAYDNTSRSTSSSGEYNPTTFADYTKDVSVYLGAAMRQSTSVGASSGTPATDSWADTSGDQGVSWIGQKVTLAPGQTKEIGVVLVGGFDNFAGATGTYDFQQAPVFDWFLSSANLDTLAADTESYWQSWIASGTQFDCPDPAYVSLFKRSLLGTALHLDGKNGGVIAGMHNGAYPFVWPRDAAWAAITLARTGHLPEAEEVIRFLRDVAYRDVEGWGRKGFWKQKYSTDGYTIWGNPQVDETSCFPWAVKFLYDASGDISILQDNYDEVYEAGLASSQDSTVDSRLHFESAVNLMYSMSLWEDTFDVTIYSNASVIRGLEDAARIADVLDQNVCPGGPGTCGYHTDRDLFNSRAATIRSGLDARLAYNGENTDIAQLGITYPFDVYAPGTARPQLVLDRINGFQPDTFGNFHPLVRDNSIPEWAGLVDRYWADSYWNGGPWFLSTLWFGAYHAVRQDVSPGTADIDVHKQKLDLLINDTGPMGFGAEQIAQDSTLKYAGQTDYRLQTAYPNAWESMSFLADSLMLFVDVRPDAPDNVLRIRPKLPSAWSWMEYDNLALGAHHVDVRVESDPDGTQRNIFTNTTGAALDFDTVLRIPAGASAPCTAIVTVNGVIAPSAYSSSLGTVGVSGALGTGAGAMTTVAASIGILGDFNGDGSVNVFDFSALAGHFGTLAGATYADGDIDGDQDVDVFDFGGFASNFGASCP